MVEFRFDIKPLFPQPIVKITSNLLPHTFRGDRRMALDTTSKMSEIIDRLGELSATSQKLNKAVTTSQRLRMSDNQKIYLLGDAEAGHNGAVIGLLKVGTKSLYLFDESGETKKVDEAPCILDFYVHESRQRAGLGKDLFETMLAEEKWTPIKLSIDRPSEKLLGFLKKHYGMEKTIPQSNNFVLYEGFFGPPGTENNNQQHANGLHITDSPNTALFGPHFIGDDNKKRIRQQDTPSPSTQITQISPVGRYAAPRPTCSMAEGIKKKESEVSLTPSQVSRLEKSNPQKKNPLDSITRAPQVGEIQEKRSGLQNVKEENLKNYFNTPFTQKNSGLNPPEPRVYNNNAAQQMQHQNNMQQQHMQQQNVQQQNMQQQNMQQQNMQQQHMQQQNMQAQHMQAQHMQQQNMQQQHMQQQNMHQQNMQQQNMHQQNMQQQNMQQQQQQQYQQPDNVGSAGGRAPVEMDNKAPPSEPKYDDNAGNVPQQGSFCTTCPNCAARILLVPESENNVDGKNTAQTPM